MVYHYDQIQFECVSSIVRILMHSYLIVLPFFHKKWELSPFWTECECVLHKSQNVSDIAFLWIMLVSKKMKKYDEKKPEHMLLITLYAEPNNILIALTLFFSFSFSLCVCVCVAMPTQENLE